MPDREAYQRKAITCLEAAEKMSDPQERAAMVAVACDFMRRADQVSRQRDPRPAHRRTRKDKKSGKRTVRATPVAP
jgi:hypothetical protein